MPDPFVHLHVASGYSLQYGASHPHVLVERAAEQGMDTLALTDRDGTYGAVKFAKACLAAGMRPALGVDLAYADPGGPGVVGAGRPAPGRTPVRGGAFRDPRLPRATFLALSRDGWAAVCRLVSATQLAGERGRPVTTPDLVAEHVAGGDVLVLLGPGSTLGAAATERRDDRARAVLDRWREIVPAGNLLVEAVSHRLPGHGPGSSPHAARMLGVAREAGLGAVLSNAVRYADRLDAPTVDVLDAARRLVALDLRHVDRGNAEGFLKSGKQMLEVAEEVCRFAGLGEREAVRLLARTRLTGDRAALDPRADLGLGEVHFPDLEFTGGGVAADADRLLRERCEGAIGWRYGNAPRQRIWKRLDDELEVIRGLGYASYFLTVADVTDLIAEMGVRAAARGSGAGSLVNYLLGVSGVDPIRHGLLMERFLSPLRQDLPDIDVDVESARRLDVYRAILDRYGGERCVCVSMMDTYRVRHAVRDVGAALGMPPGETDAIAKAFPHIRARDARVALRELPELRASGLGEERLDLMFRLVERLDGLPRHIAVHPCGVLLSDATLLDRTPVEASFAGFPMSQFDKDDVEDLGLLKLDVLGIRMQSSMAHALQEIERVDGVVVDLEDRVQVPFEDDPTYSMISQSKTLGVFQIESPGQRELVGKSGIESFEDIITDISLFRPGPVKSDMITPYLEAKQGWRSPSYLHDDLRPILGETHGVVVFHEQVIEIIARFAGISYAEADEKRRALGDVEGMAETRLWFFPRALALGYSPRVVEQIWTVLEAFASFGFCKAHAAAFALPTYQSAWLKAHWPAHFLSGVLTHDPGMYPKRLILEDARQLGITVLGLDVNASQKEYVVERLGEAEPTAEAWPPAPTEPSGLPDGSGYGIRLALSEVKGISEAEVDRVVAARPYHSLTDFWHRARVSRPVAERLVLAGGFDSVYGIGLPGGISRRGTVTRRDLLLQVAELDLHARAVERAGRGRGLAGRRVAAQVRGLPATPASTARARVEEAAARNSTDALDRESAAPVERHALASPGIWAQAAAQSQATRAPEPVTSVQLTLDLGDEPREGEASGLPEMDAEERMRAELEILGLDASRHVVESYTEFLDALGATRSKDLLRQRSKAELLVAGVKVATQTPPIRSGRRVIFLTLDDATGPVDATFFEDAQGPYAATVFHSWLLVVRGELRRTGRRGVSLRATGCWELPVLHALWQREGIAAVHEAMAVVPDGFAGVGVERAVAGAAESRATRPVMSAPQSFEGADGDAPHAATRGTAGGMGRRRVLVHSSGFRMSPYSDIKPAGEETRQVARKLWHRSPGSAG
ncbi:DNA polymerase III subunit alpha [Nocardioides guangzhouensis]|uniref:DNA polymerase III subunit alpha n=1 Tax=Nocardioides guangzhouensis TaxID=2497878 RepID=A0A4Q4Z6J1_9ACTN|nr:DNA polymerase III subunit alpha [Nocardioides guangzhouensis]RYP83353.1 DNA polymerase III subunit alpha [Nocardioides guangzhouensis]